MTVALTREVLERRLADMTEDAEAEAGSPSEHLFSLLSCDGCGAVVHVDEHGIPDDWTTEGNRILGYVDLCRGCSQ